MADDERPAKMQKRDHSPQTEEAAFAQTAQPTAANGSEDNTTTAAAQPDSAQTGATNDNDDAMSVDDNDHDNAGDNAEASTTAAASSDQPAKPGPPPGMTKSAWKKMKRQQEWEAGRDARKAQRKEKNKARKERKRQAHANGEDNNGGALDHPHKDQREAQQKLRNQKAVQLPITFIFDCSFDELMMDKEMKSLGQQITRSYSDNRNAPYRAHLCISSFGGSLKERFDGLLNQHYKSWKGFRVFEEDFVEVAEKAKDWMKDLKEGGRLAGTLAEIAAREKKSAAEAGESAEVAPNNDKEGEIVYLSSEGTETLNELKPYSTYIIGGLVDKNRYKGICHKRATERGIKTAKLPIGEFLQMNSRSVLATNHVNEIMLQWLACGDWGEAFMKVIPKRKGGQLKSTGEEDDEENDHENAEAETAEAATAQEPIENTHPDAGSSTAAAETAANQASEAAEAKTE